MLKKRGFIVETVKKQIQIGAQPTSDILNKIKEASKFDITYDGDSPKLTSDQLASFTPSHPELFKPKKQQITLKLDADIIAAFKSTGKGYQTRINETLRMSLLRGLI